MLLIEAWARDGLTDEQIAKNIGISRSTLSEWKKRFPDFSDALKRGKEVVDTIVENALLKKALGYTAEEIKTTYRSGEEFEKIVTEKPIPPDAAALIFWLKNRCPEKWRDKPSAGNDDVIKKLDKVIGDIDAIADK